MNGNFYDYYGSFDNFVDSYADFAGGAFLTGIVAVLAVAYLFTIIVSLAIYIISALGFMKMAKKAGVPHGWLAWIPIGDVYVVGKLAQKANGKKRTALLVTLYSIQLVFVIAVFIISMLTIGFVLSSDMQFAYGGDTTQIIAYAFALLFVSGIMLVISTLFCVFFWIAMYNITKMFAPKNYSGFFAGELIGFFLCPLITAILILVLSSKPLPEPQTEEPQLDAATLV